MISGLKVLALMKGLGYHMALMVNEVYPDFNDLAKHAEAGFVRRAITRYLIPRNAHASVRRHERMGTPLIRKMVMRTAGRSSMPYDRSHYRLDMHPGRLEAATNYAVKASVINEAIHTFGTGLGFGGVALDLALVHGPDLAWSLPIVAGAGISGAAVNLALVAVQRYNRARMVCFVDRRLQAGEEFNAEYQNRFGIDARAIQNFKEAQQAMPAAPAILPPPPHET